MTTPITNVRGIGASTATLLAENGISSAEELAAQKVGDLAAIKGFSETRSLQVIADAKSLFVVSAAAGEKQADSVDKETAKKKKDNIATDKKAAEKSKGSKKKDAKKKKSKKTVKKDKKGKKKK
nr:helix-hairpin-helix domain-containing protein [uncultured Desulfuromonas sp.]